MYNILIVDDEILIADGIVAMLAEENPEIICPLKAYSVKEAIKIAKEKRIDILVTDINMPEIDGFGLYERLQRLWPWCRVIFLTGFQNFEYAYQALQYKNVKYIIKAEGIAKVLEVIKEVTRELEAGMVQKVPTVMDLEQESKERLLKEILLNYMNGDLTEEELDNKEIKQLGISIELSRPLCLIGAKFDLSDRNPGYGERINYTWQINHMLKAHIPENYELIPLAMNRALLWLLQPPSKEERKDRELTDYLMNLIDLFQIHIKGALDIDSVAVICKAELLSEIRLKFYPLYTMLKTQQFSEGNLLTFEELQGIMEEKSRQDFAEINPSFTKQCIPRLEAALERHDEKELFELLTPVLEELRLVKSRHSIYAKEVYLTLSLFFLNYVNETGLYEKLPFHLSLSPLTNLEDYETWEERANYFIRLAKAIFEVNREKNQTEMEVLIEKIRCLVEDNLEKDISITQIAQKLYFNSYYLSRLYKNETGINLSDYITERKMNRAKELLEETNTKVQEVGERMGYSSPTNFIRSFKKYYGVTPNEYRRNYILRL